MNGVLRVVVWQQATIAQRYGVVLVGCVEVWTAMRSQRRVPLSCAATFLSRSLD
jgi:hypothetical protein